jgi:hypothetical protein
MRISLPMAVLGAAVILSATALFLWRYEPAGVQGNRAFRMNRITGSFAICPFFEGQSAC